MFLVCQEKNFSALSTCRVEIPLKLIGGIPPETGSLFLAQQIKGKGRLHMGLILKTRKPAQKGPQILKEVLPKIARRSPVSPPVGKMQVL
ncbi:MAG: hypothetical protein DRO11_06030, partial [Methanobacteriota archaeon]